MKPRALLTIAAIAGLLLGGLPAFAGTLPPPPPPFSRPVVTAFPGAPFVTCLQGQFEAPRPAPSDPHHWFIRPTASGPLTIELHAVAQNPVDESGSITADLFDAGTGMHLGGITVAHPTGGTVSPGAANILRFTSSSPLNAGSLYRLEARRGPATVAGTREAGHYRLGFSGLAVEVGVNTPALPNALEGERQLFHVNVDAGETLTLRLTDPVDPLPVGPQSSTVELRDDFGTLLRSVVGGTLPYDVVHGPFVSAGSVRVTVQANHHYTLTKLSGSDRGLYFDACPPTNQPPTVTLNGPDRMLEGSSVQFGALASDPDNDPLSLGWDWDEELTNYPSALRPSADGRTAMFSSPDGPRTVTIRVTVSDGRGGKATASRIVTVDNVPPSAVLSLDGNSSDALTLNEGASFTIALTNATDPSPTDTSGGFRYAFDCGDGNGFQMNDQHYLTCPTRDNGIRTVRARISDKDGGSREYVGRVEILNVAPTVGAVTAPLDPVQVGTTISASAPFTDPGTADTHTANVNWGDGTTSPAAIGGTAEAGSGIASGTHTYTTPCLCTVVVGVLDDDQLSLGMPDDQPRTSTFRYVVVYDPEGPFASGSGRIDSPAGAFTADPNAIGEAIFGFGTRYVRGGTTPEGSVEFLFRAANSFSPESSSERLRFQSDSLRWLVAFGSRAIFSGTGTVNGVGGYRFLVSVVDGQFRVEYDNFRMKIWNASTGEIIYDNELGMPDDQPVSTAIRAGNIALHK